MSKIYETILESQIKAHVISSLSARLCGFREGYGTHNALVRLMETCKKRTLRACLHGGGLACLGEMTFASVYVAKQIHPALPGRPRISLSGSFLY